MINVVSFGFLKYIQNAVIFRASSREFVLWLMLTWPSKNCHLNVKKCKKLDFFLNWQKLSFFSKKLKKFGNFFWKHENFWQLKKKSIFFTFKWQFLRIDSQMLTQLSWFDRQIVPTWRCWTFSSAVWIAWIWMWNTYRRVCYIWEFFSCVICWWGQSLS